MTPDEDPHRFCNHCAADTNNYQPHRDDCPETTGLYTVDARDVRDELGCDCGHTFNLGDPYVRIGLSDHVAEISCVGCAIHRTLEASA